MSSSSTSSVNGFYNPTFEDYRRMAQDPSLSCYEKVGFPDAYRKESEPFIFEDILHKLPTLNQKNKVVLDIGPGCSQLPHMLIALCERNGHTLLLVDSEEMLALLPDKPFIQKHVGQFPKMDAFVNEFQGRVDCLLSYSVLQIAFKEGFFQQFADTALSLLSEGGEMLLGDVPNISKRKRFFASSNGVRYHQHFTGENTLPTVQFNQMEPDHLDDGTLFGLMMRARLQGFDSYLLPQDSRLPFANRREDLLFTRP